MTPPAAISNLVATARVVMEELGTLVGIPYERAAGERTLGPVQDRILAAVEDIEGTTKKDARRLAERARGAWWTLALTEDGLPRKYAGKPPDEDLLQEGRLGLFEAARRYELGDNTFRTYALWWVRALVFRARDKGVVPVPGTVRELRIKANRADLDGLPLAEAAEQIGCTPEQLQDARSLSVDSLDRWVSNENGSRELRLGDTLGEDPTEGVERGIDIRAALGSIPNERRRAIAEGIAAGRSVSEIAEQMGVSKERVRQLFVQVEHALTQRGRALPRALARAIYLLQRGRVETPSQLADAMRISVREAADLYWWARITGALELED